MKESLSWPIESATGTAENTFSWSHPRSNLCLDFHGDPVTAKFVVFSDGNHHMALESSLQAFRDNYPEIIDVFYATTPPGVLVNYLKAGQLTLGNLKLSRLPDVFISPAGIMDVLLNNGFITHHQPFMASRGNVLLVRKSNPCNIQGIGDLLRDDVRLFISNPVTEKASFDVYSDTIRHMANDECLSIDVVDRVLSDPDRTCFGECIHHREAPQALHDGAADVALIYYHLALRYKRIFPDYFDFIELPYGKSNITTTYHIGIVNHENSYSQLFIDYMFSAEVTSIYSQHGLQRP